MGRVKVPRCDNCGAPVEFEGGALEARCAYCGEMLIRELPPARPQPPAPQPLAQQRYVPPSPAYRVPRTKVWPLVIASGATVAIAGASGIATFAANFRPLSEPAADAHATLVPVPVLHTEAPSVSLRSSDLSADLTGAARAPDAGASRSARSTRPKTAAPATATTSAPPPKPPPFDTKAAVAGLDAARDKAEAACQSSTVPSFFVQMGFDPDGKNRGAALSNSKFNGTPEAKCVLRIFRAVRIPAFDPATKPSGLGRMVRL